MSRLTLMVLAKAPVPGRVKTRLTPELSAVEAADVAAAALADTLSVVAAAPARRRVLVLDGAAGAWLPEGFDVVPQVGGGLDRRLAGAFARVDGPAFLVGMDTPQITTELLDVALTGPDAAIGLCEDGGFWGIGMGRPLPGVFLGVPMSTDQTGRRQRARLVEAGLRVQDLRVLRDVDTMDDARHVASLVPASRFSELLARLPGPRIGFPVEHLYDEVVRARQTLRLVALNGQVPPFDIARWTGEADAVDLDLLHRCEGVVLDVGCGPGRMAAAITGLGRPVLGVDVAGTSVDRTAAAGALALRRSVFDRLPGEGRWDTVLLADGNLGIGADPDRLLCRVRELLRPGGLLLVEPEPDEVDERVHLCLQTADGAVASDSFEWARVGVSAAVDRAERLGFSLEERWEASGRTFLALRLVAVPGPSAI
jgi:glycosyltransferase A (GT-A) superfamily protein (DUF2064 family)/SAM-dependent methyltransferase